MHLTCTVIEQHIDIDLVDRDLLKGHEEVIQDNLQTRLSKMRVSGFYKPIIVDASTMIILDGHHKCTAAALLNLDRVPVILVDYLGDESIDVDVWSGCGRESITKQEVIEMGLSDEVFPPKTSRHSFAFDVPSIHIPLEDLRS